MSLGHRRHPPRKLYARYHQYCPPQIGVGLAGFGRRRGDFRIMGVCNSITNYSRQFESASLGYWIGGGTLAGSGITWDPRRAISVLILCSNKPLRLHRVRGRKSNRKNGDSKKLGRAYGFRKWNGFLPKISEGWQCLPWPDHERWAIRRGREWGTAGAGAGAALINPGRGLNGGRKWRQMPRS